MQSWYWRNLVSVENRCVLFRGFAPTGRDSIAQGAALGDGTTNIGKPQRGQPSECVVLLLSSTEDPRCGDMLSVP